MPSSTPLLRSTPDRSGMGRYLRRHLPGWPSLGSIRRGVPAASGDRLGVRPIDEKPPQSPSLRQTKPTCYMLHAEVHRSTDPAGFFPSRRPLPVAATRCSSSPLETRRVARTVLHTLRHRVDKSAFLQFQRALWLWGPPPLTTTWPWLHLGPAPSSRRRRDPV